jgi:phage terminase large subunit GpA-like protein
MCPSEVKFITAAVDVGIGKFDVSFRGWDLEARSWWIDRYTIKHRTWPDGIDRDIRTRERIEDWWVLIDKVLTRKFPIMGLEGWAMPVAVMTVDVGDGNVTWKGREFARRHVGVREPVPVTIPIDGGLGGLRPSGNLLLFVFGICEKCSQRLGVFVHGCD